VSELSAEVDVVLVVGSKNSSNSLRLVETAKELGRDAYLVDHAAEVQPDWLMGKRAVLVTAGSKRAGSSRAIADSTAAE
jgi:4-hydroxy-3-methylbut-2-enyl diphosphate reductase